jgi:CheY-like chemotaxis protein
MTGDLLSLRLLLLTRSMADRDLMRQGAAAARVPVDLLDTDESAAARAMLAGNEIDVVFIDGRFPATERLSVIADARAARVQPFVFIVVASGGEAQAFTGAGADGAIVRTTSLDEVKSLVERCIGLRLPHPVLVVDDSSTMRSIVRKILIASRFQLDVGEAQEGLEALRQIASGRFELVFLDYIMPGLNGVETLSEIKRQYPTINVVVMASTPDDVMAERARVAGAMALLRKPFYPKDVDAILHRLFGLSVQR